MEKKIISNQYIILLAALICWLLFIFLDASKKLEVRTINQDIQISETQRDQNT
jgi:hypothetical protein